VAKELALDWPSLLGSNFYFWFWEWWNHGVFSEEQFPKLEYFKLAMEIYKQNDMFDMLKKEKIVPKMKELYNVSSVIEAVKKHTQHDPQIKCYTHAKLRVLALYEIRVCLTTDGRSYRDCPDPHGTCGTTHLLYPK